jgi:hypothetical protein
METISIETQPNADKNVSLLTARLGNFDLMGPLRGPCLWVEMFNTKGEMFDGTWVKVDGDDWQNWPCDQTEEQDYEYLSSVILKKLNFDKRHKLVFTQGPQIFSFTEGSSYDFSCSIYSYPSENISYQWYKNNQEIAGAVSSGYQIQNAQLDQTGYYSVVVSNSEFTITGAGGLYLDTPILPNNP